VARLLALLASLVALAAATPQTAVLRITVTVTAADGSTRPVPRHVLFISDDPVTMAPQRFVTRGDGIAEAHLRPGKYIVESDTPFIFEGKAYEWSQRVTVAPAGESALALNSGNAAIEAAKPGTADSPAIAEAAVEQAETALLTDWQDSVVTIWTPRIEGRGFLVDARGLILTNQRLIGTAATVEVQFSTSRKVAGRVVASDPNKNVAVIWIDPQAAAPAKPMRLAYSDGDKTPVRARDQVYSIEGRTGEAKNLVSGAVEGLNTHTVTSDVPLDRGSSGAPLFTVSGEVVAITTASDEATVVNELSPRAVRVDDARPAIAEAEKKMQGAAPPPPTLLPVDPQRPFPEDALKNAARGRGANSTTYLVSAADFDVHIITPPVVYAAMHKDSDHQHFDYGREDATQAAQRLLDDFGTWNEYVSEAPPVVLIRVSPKFGESFWTTVARGAAQTQGMSIPAIKRPKANFGSLRLLCGDTEVSPIHPFRIEHRVDDAASIDEGLYVFDSSAISPQCGAVKIVLFSDKPSDKGETRTIDAKIVEQVWGDFAPYRTAAK
jgi:S1-C subfamily serine protease